MACRHVLPDFDKQLIAALDAKQQSGGMMSWAKGRSWSPMPALYRHP
jgi:hypothetical protein